MVLPKEQEYGTIEMVYSQYQPLLITFIILSVISREIKPLAALYPPPYKKCYIRLRSRTPLSEVARGGMLMPTAFALLSIASSKKNLWGRGYNAAKGLISRDIATNL